MKNPLISLLRARKLTLTALAAMIHPRRREAGFTPADARAYLPHLSRHLNGHESIRRDDALNPTWQRLKQVLTGDEFEAALTHAENVRPVRTNI